MQSAIGKLKILTIIEQLLNTYWTVDGSMIQFLEAWILSRWDALLYQGAREQPPQLLANPAPPNQSSVNNSNFQSVPAIHEAFLP